MHLVGLFVFTFAWISLAPRSINPSIWRWCVFLDWASVEFLIPRRVAFHFPISRSPAITSTSSPSGHCGERFQFKQQTDRFIRY